LRLLLDTHIFLWWADAPERLRPAHRDAIENAASEVHLSVASIWEMAIKIGTGRLDFPVSSIESLAARHGVTLLPVRAAHAVAVATLPLLHRDPFDRMLVAQASCEGLTLVTEDAAVRRYPVALL